MTKVGTGKMVHNPILRLGPCPGLVCTIPHNILTIPHGILEPIGDESCPALANVNVPLLRNKHCFMAEIDLFYVNK